MVLRHSPCEGDGDYSGGLVVKAGLGGAVGEGEVAVTDPVPVNFREEGMELGPDAKVICTTRSLVL